MVLLSQEITMVPVECLHIHPENPRRGDLRVIQESIRANGFYGALVVQRSSGRILAGNHRFQAALAEGFQQFPVLYVDVDDALARRILLADNRTNDLAEYDEQELAKLLTEVKENSGNLHGTGYTIADLDALLKCFSDNGDDDSTNVSPEPGEHPAPPPLPESWQVLVDCGCEQKQVELLDRLHSEGWACRALTS